MANEGRVRGETIVKELLGVVPVSNPTNKEMMNITIEHLFGAIWSREGLAMRDRSMITVAALTVLGKEPQLKVHLKGARRLGISKEELKEMMIHLAHYGGWPAGVTGLQVLQSVFDEEDYTD